MPEQCSLISYFSIIIILVDKLLRRSSKLPAQIMNIVIYLFFICLNYQLV